MWPSGKGSLPSLSTRSPHYYLSFTRHARCRTTATYRRRSHFVWWPSAAATLAPFLPVSRATASRNRNVILSLSARKGPASKEQAMIGPSRDWVRMVPNKLIGKVSINARRIAFNGRAGVGNSPPYSTYSTPMAERARLALSGNGRKLYPDANIQWFWRWARRGFSPSSSCKPQMTRLRSPLLCRIR